MAVKECPDCHGPIDNAEASFCPHCGRPLSIASHRPDEKRAQAQPPPRTTSTRSPPTETDQWLRDAFGQAARAQPRPSRVVPDLPVYGQVPLRTRSLRLRTVVVIAVAALIVVIAGGVAGFLVSRDGGEVTTTMASSPTTQPPPPTSQPLPPSTTEPPSSTSSETTSAPDDGDDWPEREGWTVIIASLPVEDEDSRAAAEKFKQKLVDQGIEAGVLLSSSYSSLNPGYWAVFSGVFDTESQAIEHRNTLKSAYRDAYARRVKR